MVRELLHKGQWKEEQTPGSQVCLRGWVGRALNHEDNLWKALTQTEQHTWGTF